MRLFVLTFRLFFEMFLAFSWQIASPTKTVMTASARDMSTAGSITGDTDAAFRIRTPFRAMFKVQLSQYFFVFFVIFNDLLNLLVICAQINTIDCASLERMSLLTAVEAKQKLTVLTAANIFFGIQISQSFATGNRAPSKVVHSINGCM